jgi:hypothetical protein
MLGKVRYSVIKAMAAFFRIMLQTNASKKNCADEAEVETYATYFKLFEMYPSLIRLASSWEMEFNQIQTDQGE